ncbi:MAG TPA: gliding motility-associated C-terminal domain-containing protein, partial [Chryseolinea sp.]
FQCKRKREKVGGSSIRVLGMRAGLTYMTLMLQYVFPFSIECIQRWIVSFCAMFFFASLLVVDNTLAQTKPRIIFEKTLGSADEDVLLSAVQTPDKGFLLVGGTAIYQTPDGDDLHGLSNGVLIKVDGNGNKLWQKNFGGDGDDGINVIIEALDGGYILGGSSKSNPESGNKTSPLHSSGDFWIIKVDEEGNKIWEMSYGEGSRNILQQVISTSDGNYMLAGTSRDNNQDNTDKSYDDFWIVKIDEFGHKLWGKTFGGDSNDLLYCITSTSDGGYILGGTSQSGVSGDKTESNFGIFRHDDYWIVKIDSQGRIEWDRTFGGETSDVPTAIEELDNGYLIGGYSLSIPSGNKTTDLINPAGSNHTSDLWFIKVDRLGNQQWQKRIGGDDFDIVNNMKKSADGNFVLFGSSWSARGYEKESPSMGGSDMWIVKMNEQAEVIWDIALGGSAEEQAFNGLLLSDSVMFVVGYSNSNISGDKSENNLGQGLKDGWAVKFGLKTEYCPIVDLGMDTVLCKGELMELSVTSEALGYRWNNDESESSNKFLVDKPGAYDVMVTFANCVVRDSINIEFTSSFCRDIIPNVITPNGDDLNEFFVIELPDRWYVSILDRHGESLYESSDYRNDWNGSEVPSGVYYYRVVNEKKSREYKGWLKVIK